MDKMDHLIAEKNKNIKDSQKQFLKGTGGKFLIIGLLEALKNEKGLRHKKGVKVFFVTVPPFFFFLFLHMRFKFSLLSSDRSFIRKEF
jgi:hypothetical protein